MDTVYMVETKNESDIETTYVQARGKAALEYYKYAIEFNLKNGRKVWCNHQPIFLPTLNIIKIAQRYFEKQKNGGKILFKYEPHC